MNTNDKEQIAAIWRACFHDSDDFIRFFFDRIYRPENTLVMRENGRVVSALQMLPYTMTFGKRLLDTAYLGGVCTHPEEQRRGLMKRLMEDSLREMELRGIPLSVLIPADDWLFRFYARFGFATAFYRTEEVCTVLPGQTGEQWKLVPADSVPEPELYAFFSREMHRRDYTIQHDAEQLRIILHDLMLDGGAPAVLTDGTGTIGALAFVRYPEHGTLHLADLLARSKEAEEALLRQLAARFRAHRIKRLRPVRAGEGTPFGMLRVIDAPTLLSCYAGQRPEADLTLHLTDPQLPRNDGYYRIREGVCRRHPGPLPDATELEIAALPGILFEGAAPGMSLMLE